MQELALLDVHAVAGGRLLGDVGFYLAGLGTMLAVVPGAQIPAASLLLSGGTMMVADALFN